MKKILSQIVILVLFISFNTKAWENCGQIEGKDSNCEYDISSDGVLTIRPIDSQKIGIMPNYGIRNECCPEVYYLTTAPWGKDYLNITDIRIEDGIKEIGGNAFLAMININSVSMADSVTKIKNGAFAILPELRDITLPQHLEYLGNAVFQDDYALTNIDLPEGLETMEWNPFVRTGVTSLALPDSLINVNENLFTNYSGLTTLYCSKAKEKQCADWVKQAKDTGLAQEGLTYLLYEKYGDTYFYDGKFYDKLGYIGTPNHIKKRIYTIDEANTVAGEKNHVSIRYR